MESIYNIDSILKIFRRWRTRIPWFIIPAFIIEDILTGKRPHELLPPDVCAIAIIGVVIILAGISIRVWARGHFKKGRLFTTGPYALIRHPLYVGSLLIWTGLLLILNDWLHWLIFIPYFVIFYGATIISEERSLKRRFGLQWELYRARVPAFIPVPRRKWPLDTGRWCLRTFLRTREHHTVLIIIIMVILLEVIEEWLF